jgi:protein-tyrosine phosphatase
MAEGFLSALVEERGLDHFMVESAGTHAPEGSSPSSPAVQAAAEWGADIAAYRAVLLNRLCVEEADLILVMEKAHLEYILSAWPEEGGEKVKLIRSFHPEHPSSEDVPDPIGTPISFYRQVARLLKDCAEGLMAHLAPPTP